MVPDLPVLPQGSRSHTGLGPHCPQGRVLPEEGGSRAKEGRSRGAAIVLTGQFLLPFSLPTPPIPGESGAKQKINPKTVSWMGLRLLRRSSREARMEERWPVATLPKSSRVPDLFPPAPHQHRGSSSSVHLLSHCEGQHHLLDRDKEQGKSCPAQLEMGSPALERVPQGISLCLLVWSSQSFRCLTSVSPASVGPFISSSPPLPQLPGLDV